MSTAIHSQVVDRLIIGSASDGIFAADVAAGKILMANPALETITGYAVETLVQAPLSLLVPPPEEDSESPGFCAEMLNRPGLHEDVRLRRADGYAFHATMTVGHAPSRPSVAVCIVRDAGERRMLERELITKHVALRQAFEELERRNVELAQVSSRLALVSKRAALADVFAGVAHGLNNPLAAALSSARVLRTLLADIVDDGERREHGIRLCERIQSQCGRMEAIIAELRRACRIGERRSEPIEIDVINEVRSVLALFSHRLTDDVDIIETLEDVPPALAAPDDFHHVVSNLIDNALRAVDGCGRLWIEVTSTGAGIDVAVEDSGPGVPEDVAERLFEPFVSRSKGGTGIGLSISSRLVRAWGGSLRLERGRERGARFIISLCAKEEPCQRAASS